MSARRKSTKALLDRDPQREALYSLLEVGAALQFKKLPSFPFFSASNLNESITNIHFSWFLEPLKKMKPHERSLFLPLFPMQTQTQIKKFVDFSITPIQTARFLHPYLQNYLIDQIQKNRPPRSLLEQTELSVLLTISTENLLSLLDYLGILDLAAQLSQIVDRTLLSTIYQSLKPSQLKFLHYASKQSMIYAPKKLDLTHLSKDKGKLNKLLHRRGLARLAGAISDEKDEFQWHLLHKLDTGRAAVIEKTKDTELTKELIQSFRKDVVNLAKRVTR